MGMDSVTVNMADSSRYYYIGRHHNTVKKSVQQDGTPGTAVELKDPNKKEDVSLGLQFGLFTGFGINYENYPDKYINIPEMQGSEIVPNATHVILPVSANWTLLNLGIRMRFNKLKGLAIGYDNLLTAKFHNWNWLYFEGPGSESYVYVNSSGGSVWTGLTIESMPMRHKNTNYIIGCNFYRVIGIGGPFPDTRIECGWYRYNIYTPYISEKVRQYIVSPQIEFIQPNGSTRFNINTDLVFSDYLQSKQIIITGGIRLGIVFGCYFDDR
jgi:hypothetical protein